MVPHLTKQDLEAIRERARKATPGPWCVAGSPRDFVVARHGGSERCSDNPVLWAEDDCLAGDRADAEFVAEARGDVPRLVDEVERLREVLRRALVWQLGLAFAAAGRDALIATWPTRLFIGRSIRVPDPCATWRGRWEADRPSD